MRYIKRYSIIICSGCFVLLFFWVLTITSAEIAVLADNAGKEKKFPTIIIDAGHGGEDGGASSRSGLLEKDINLDISLYMRDILEFSGFDVIMIREKDCQIYDDTCKTLREKKVSDTHKRLDICNSSDDAIYVSVHQNYFTDSKYSGAQVFYSPNCAESESLAESVRNSVVNLLQPHNKRANKPSDENIYILHNAKNPCVLVECGFLSNSEDSKLLGTEIYRKKLAFSLCQGIIEFCNTNY